MIKKIFTYILLGTTLGLSGCNDWLTLEPKSEIAANALFKTPEGFSIALNGIYTNLSSATLYGKELKSGFVDVLARYYELNNPTYESLERYEYDQAKQMIESIWSLSYNTIANCNSILERVAEKDSAFFEGSGKRMLEGEALSVRALLYFDLLRLFAPAPVIMDKAAIPYYPQLTNMPMPYRKTSEILALLIADLQKSKQLQKDFDTSTEAVTWFKVPYRFSYTKGFYGNSRRGYRMGYYATTALLAKVAQYAGNTQLALENARELVENNTMIDLTLSATIESSKYDRLLSDDIIFAVYSKDFEEDFDEHNFLVANAVEMFGNDGDDFRKKCYVLNLGDKNQLTKYVLTKDNTREGSITYTIPMFRLSEMYYIMIESMFDSDPQGALQLFNSFRTKRGCKTPLPTILTKESLYDYLLNDARREFIGEGQLFFMYKRLNKVIIDENGGNQTLTDKFVIPVPEREVSGSN